MKARRLVGPSLVRWVLILALVLVGFFWLVNRLGAVPQTQEEAEAHLDRQILAYAVWEETPYVVFEYGGTVHFDRLMLDWFSMDWPPTPRWQWTGFWSTIESTTDPASVGRASTGVDRVIYGQLNSDEIVWVEVQADGLWHRYPLTSPGFAIRLADDLGNPDGYRWLDAEERVVWTMDRAGD